MQPQPQTQLGDLSLALRCGAEYEADAAERVTACVLVAGAAPLLATSQRPRRLGQRIEGGRLIENSKLNLERSKNTAAGDATASSTWIYVPTSESCTCPLVSN